jgi:uncharacterized protein YqfA (UPF0365 family)
LAFVAPLADFLISQKIWAAAEQTRRAAASRKWRFNTPAEQQLVVGANLNRSAKVEESRARVVEIKAD